MKLELIKPFASLNKAYRKQNLNHEQVKLFKDNLLLLFKRINDHETEENFKNIVSDFLKDTYYKGFHEINTKGRQDLVIHNDKTSASQVGVIIEVKRPSNKLEMVTADKPNTKALHELLHYYMHERYINNNKEIKHLVVTNIYEWFVFDGADFERFFFDNPKLKKSYQDWNNGLFGLKTTDWFYQEYAKPFIEKELPLLNCTYFNLLEAERLIRTIGKPDDKKLIDLYKILSPEHMLKKPFANDSNTLNKDFYTELLHIIGLEETKALGKKLITRANGNDRHDGSLLENTLNLIATKTRLASQNRSSHEVQEISEGDEFEIAMELCITWINRVLFLKLLEAQLLKFNKGDKSFSFLNINKIVDFDDLNDLFLNALANPIDKRRKDIHAKFDKLPYLNSSLFEETQLEIEYAIVSNLKKRSEIPVSHNTVLKEANGKRITGQKNTLQYLFEFLDAYNFESDGTAEIQAQHKTIINASVLGLIFEKINGYKDGSIFTPSFITTYMCRETIRKAVVQKFNQQYNWGCHTFNDLFNKLDKISIKEANETINSLKICDIAVGSGHFLVSALNEMISIKNDLEILADQEGKRLRGYHVSTENDELVISHEDGFFIYNVKDKESQRIQETLFLEKQTLIENCLFGVDINPKSVMICRLRLWIELLKNMYYTPESNFTQLETLPNIDINIKHGNSLISRFDVRDNYAKMPAAAQQKIRLTTQKYKEQVLIYKCTPDKATRKQAERAIYELKQGFSQIANPTDADYKKWKDKDAELGLVPLLFSVEEQEAWKLKVAQLANEALKLRNIYEQKLHTLYGNAFEWRFEFPEVLNNDGQFEGFDIVIGNPPYIRQEEFTRWKTYLLDNYKTYTGTADLYVFFVEKGFGLLKPNGFISFIMPNKWIQAGYGKPLRSFLLKNQLLSIIDFGDLQVFDGVTTYPCIINATNIKKTASFKSILVKTLKFENGFHHHVDANTNEIDLTNLGDENWVISSGSEQMLLHRIKNHTVSLFDYTSGSAHYGIKTGLTEAFLINTETKERLISQDAASARLLKPFLLGRNIKPYSSTIAENWLILIPKGFTIKRNLPPTNPNYLSEPPARYGDMPYDNAWDWFSKSFPAVAAHLLPFKSKAELRTDKGDYWWELRACDYYGEFETPKIMYQVLQVKPCFIYDNAGQYCNNSMWIIPKDDKFLVGILNSKMGWWLISKYCTAIQNGYQLIWKYFGQIPIPNVSDAEKAIVIEVVNQIIVAKRQNSAFDATVLEKQIDKLIYRLYNISAEEELLIEGQTQTMIK